MYFCNHNGCSLPLGSERALRSHTSSPHKCGFDKSVKAEKVKAVNPFSAGLFGNGRKMRVDRAADDCFAPSPNEEKAPTNKTVPADKTCLPESVSLIPDRSSLMPTTDKFGKHCGMFLCIAKKISDRTCTELLKCFLKNKALSLTLSIGLGVLAILYNTDQTSNQMHLTTPCSQTNCSI